MMWRVLEQNYCPELCCGWFWLGASYGQARDLLSRTITFYGHKFADKVSLVDRSGG